MTECQRCPPPIVAAANQLMSLSSARPMVAGSNEQANLSFSESLLETWSVREAFLFFCLVVDPDTPTWRAWLAYKNSPTGKAFKAAKRNAPAYLKLLDQYRDEITETVVRELVSQPGSKRVAKVAHASGIALRAS
jgi:hypothetical protein